VARTPPANRSSRCVSACCWMKRVTSSRSTRQGWVQEDAVAFSGLGRRFDLPAALERSRSGRGVMSGSSSIRLSRSARPKAGSRFLLTETMEERPDIGWIRTTGCSQPGHDATRRIREPDRPALQRRAAIRGTACSSTSIWHPGRTSGPSGRPFASRSGRRRSAGQEPNTAAPRRRRTPAA